MSQLTMFRMTLKLENEEIGTSDDPLERYLEGKGWLLERVRELQASIASKMTPDLFTNETEELSQPELILQEHIEEFFRVAAQTA